MITLVEIQSYLRERGADGWLLYHFRDQNPIARSVAGIEQGGSRRWYLWIPAVGRPVWIAHEIERSNFRALPEDLEGEVRLYVSWQDLTQALAESVLRDGEPAKRILMEYSPGNANPYVSRVDAGAMEMVTQATGAGIESSEDLVQLAAAVIQPQHVEGHKEAAVICESIKEDAFNLIADRLRAGETVSEYEVQQFIADQFAGAGLSPARSIVAVNGNAADPHYFPSEQLHSTIHRGDVVLIDLWNRLQGDPDACVADITWTAYCGDTVPPKVESIFRIVIEARDTAIDYMTRRLTAGDTVYGYEVDDACRSVITKAGYGDAFFHRTGHSLGPTGHFIGVNIDNLETQDRRSLLSGVMFSIEPGIYLPDFDYDDSGESKGLGIRSEIDCYVHPDRVEVTTLPIQTGIRPLLA